MKQAREGSRSLVNRDAILKLSAYLVREAAGLDDMETVPLSLGAEGVRKMALAARDDMDRFRSFVRSAGQIVSDFGVCSWADDDEDTCLDDICPYCALVCLVQEVT